MGSFDFIVADYERAMACELALVTNRSFLYGEGATTCALWRGDHILFWPDHWQRLQGAWLEFYPRCPKALLRGKIEQTLDRAMQKAGPSLEDRYVKICLFANDDERSVERKHDDTLPNTVVFGGKYHPADGSIALETVVRQYPLERGRWHKLPFYVEELHHQVGARKKGYDDVLFVSAQGQVLEGSWSNVFLTFGEEVVTPALCSEILAGVGRKQMIRLLLEKGVVCTERWVHRSELRQVDGAWLTSALGARVVGYLNGRRLSCPLAQRVQQFFPGGCG